VPDQAAEALNRVADSVDRFAAVTTKVHDSVRSLSRRQRRQEWVLYLLVIAVALLIFGAVVDYNERQEAKDARTDIAHVIDEIDKATSPEAQARGAQRTAEAVGTINATNIAIAQCEREQAPDLQQCVAAKVTTP